MFKILIIACCTWALAASQGQFDYVYDYDAPVDAPAPQPIARGPPPATFQPQGRPPAPPRSRPQGNRPPPVQQASRFDQVDSVTEHVPIVKDSRRIDTKTGAFVYEYAGADGSEKHEIRYSNGTVTGNYTFINDLGERETRFYTAGVQDPSAIDETTDPNYVDLGNYDLYKHLEQPYIHTDGTAGFQTQRAAPRPGPPQQGGGRPRAQGGPRSSAPRPVAARPPPPPPPPPAPVPLDFNDDTALFQQSAAGAAPVFDYEDFAAGAPPPPPPRPVAQPIPVAPPPQFLPSPTTRGRQGGRPRAQAPPRGGQPQSLDFSGQSADSILDSLISRFN